jgi:hypothetical protein
MRGGETMRKSRLLLGAGVLISLAAGLPQRALADGPYKVSKVVKVGGEGTFDTAFADVEGRRLYIPRKGPGRITVPGVSCCQDPNIFTSSPHGHLTALKKSALD